MQNVPRNAQESARRTEARPDELPRGGAGHAARVAPVVGVAKKIGRWARAGMVAQYRSACARAAYEALGERDRAACLLQRAPRGATERVVGAQEEAKGGWGTVVGG